MDKSQLNDLLARYQRGEVTLHEKKLVDAFMLMAENEDASFFEQEKEDIKNRIWGHLDTTKASGGKVRQLSPQLRRFAAAGIILLGLSVTSYIFKYQLLDLVNPIAIKTIETGPYEIKQVYLPDSSIVTLAQNSSISFPEHYRRNKRHAVLHGTAFFDITHDAATPFNVESGALKIKVLGTSFEVEDSKSGYEASVTVLTGRVQVSHENNQLAVLGSNEQVTYDKFSKQSGILHNMDAAALTRWTNNQLVFNEAPLTVVVKTLQVYYGMKITASKNALKAGGTFSGAFGRNETRKEVLDVICLSSGLSYAVTKDSTIILRD